MTRPLHILLIAPSAPPKNSPESMQVGRFLDALDQDIRVTLVTTPIVAGWAWKDSSLAVKRPRVDVITPALPFPQVTHRVLANRRLSFLHSPDRDFWITWFAKYVLRRLPDMPDVIYSRSGSFSAAMLARRIKSMTGRPWLMHLSDPWFGSPYRPLSSRRKKIDQAQEAICFADADMISLTTEGQADYYRGRYPVHAQFIAVTPNMMPAIHPLQTTFRRQGPLLIVYTGAIHSDRNPETLLEAMSLLCKTAPEIVDQIRIDFYGNMSDEMAIAIRKSPNFFVHRPVSFDRVKQLQAEADLLLSIEPDGDNPLLPHFLLSKIVDYLATCKPILAIALPGSETDRLCRAGLGWAFAPGSSAALADKLVTLVRLFRAGQPLGRSKDLNTLPYRAETITRDISNKLFSLVDLG